MIKDEVLENAFAFLTMLEELYLAFWQHKTGEPLQKVSAKLKHLKLKYCDQQPEPVPDIAIQKALQRFTCLESLEMWSKCNLFGSALEGLSSTIQELCLIFGGKPNEQDEPRYGVLDSECFAQKLQELTVLNTLILRNVNKLPLKVFANFSPTLTNIDLRNSCQLIGKLIGFSQTSQLDDDIFKKISKVANFQWGDLGADDKSYGVPDVHTHVL